MVGRARCALWSRFRIRIAGLLQRRSSCDSSISSLGTVGRLDSAGVQTGSRESHRPRPIHKAPATFDHLALFSGGLDSLIGAVDALESGRAPLLISHAGEGATSDAQSTIFRALKVHYRERSFDRLRLWMAFPNGLVAGSADEKTTRGRSFLFFALGALAGSGFNRAVTLKVPENGLIAVNVPLDPLRLGALSTRTTHPFYMARWNDALVALDVQVQMENPYWDKTKGEMVRNCANGTLLRRLTGSSVSCASPTKGRWKGVGHPTLRLLPSVPDSTCGFAHRADA